MVTFPYHFIRLNPFAIREKVRAALPPALLYSTKLFIYLGKRTPEYFRMGLSRATVKMAALVEDSEDPPHP